MRLLTLAGWTLRARAPRIAAAHRLVWLGLLFFVVEFWTVIDWSGLARRIADAGPIRGALGAALVLGAARAVGPVGIDRPFARLLSRVEVGLALLPTGMAVAAPALAVALLFPGGPLPRLVGWAAIALGARFWPVMLVASVAAEAVGDAFLPARLLIDLPLLLAAGWRTRTTPNTGGWRPRTPFGALIGRDVLCLWRLDRGVVLGAFAVAPLPAVLVWGLRRNGQLPTAELARAIAVLLCLLAPGPAAALGRLRERLGARFAPRSWPVSPLRRLGALVAVFLLLLAPTHAAMAATGGLAASTPPLGIAAMLAAGAVWLAARPVPRVPWFAVWAVATLPFAMTGAWLSAAVVAFGVLAHASRRARWS